MNLTEQSHVDTLNFPTKYTKIAFMKRATWEEVALPIKAVQKGIESRLSKFSVWQYIVNERLNPLRYKT